MCFWDNKQAQTVTWKAVDTNRYEVIGKKQFTDDPINT